MKTVSVYSLGIEDYEKTWELQKKLQAKRIDGKIGDLLLLLEHPHTFTLGKSGSETNLLLNEKGLQKNNVKFFRIERGGDITYHGPGQLVGYPILDLNFYKADLHFYLRNLEEVIIQTLAFFGIFGEKIEGLTGVWVNNAKVCAMGINTKKWVTMHGFALNIFCNLDFFDKIIPCGITGKSVTSMEKLLEKKLTREEVEVVLLEKFKKFFEVELILRKNIEELKN
ncbi:lipoyl(octanoyl) transferase LipB [bacterium]|nr:lipoyl(octanoyl) transferase LipB [bacterium]